MYMVQEEKKFDAVRLEALGLAIPVCRCRGLGPPLLQQISHGMWRVLCIYVPGEIV